MSSEKPQNFKRLILVEMAVLILIAAAAVLSVLLLDMYVGSFSDNRLYTSAQNVPPKRAALVLGTVKTFQGRPNLFYEYRLNAAAQLWNAGKIDAIVVSGDNSEKHYDEPTSMKNDLIERGIPAEFITADYAGFRTLDSIVRASEIFGLDDYIIVSQRFHCQRALYLASQKGYKAIGFCADDVPGTAGKKQRLREILARTKAVMDILINTKPKFLGEKETVKYRQRKKSD
ncbi:vancomycin high temperature exclusion protein [Limihaloglobus sulfuriphilus]|uniref:Vancomycin high temperature exclusion protein n=1 Tax=Limihaloglobus sulfuriphilus TaxID=1851148 RepID=A0A1Q2MG50_9BACT|nr:ElyC/SanA/YdcF family protein [Limihaloglobus sulfuriphilus]AQQ71528.1 vancomycin high temperature exclusion protein [Limihaloglobus sulfuriphilus]